VAQRIKGQEIELMVIMDGRPLTSITDVRSFEVAAKTDMLEESYLGETTDRYDEIFKGVRGRMDLHFENKDIFNLLIGVIDRARRRTPGTIINIKATLNFPNGDRPMVLINNVVFGELPINFASRSDYGAITLDFQSSNLTFITA
jgi:hypothetical protein